MQPQHTSVNGPAWQAALDPQLTGRLTRPWVKPGIIGNQLARSIFARTQRMVGGAPWRVERAQRWVSEENPGASQAPIVYAQLRQHAADQAGKIEAVATIPVPEVVERPIAQASRVRQADTSANSPAGQAIQRKIALPEGPSSASHMASDTGKQSADLPLARAVDAPSPQLSSGEPQQAVEPLPALRAAIRGNDTGPGGPIIRTLLRKAELSALQPVAGEEGRHAVESLPVVRAVVRSHEAESGGSIMPAMQRRAASSAPQPLTGKAQHAVMGDDLDSAPLWQSRRKLPSVPASQQVLQQPTRALAQVQRKTDSDIGMPSRSQSLSSVRVVEKLSQAPFGAQPGMPLSRMVASRTGDAVAPGEMLIQARRTDTGHLATLDAPWVMRKPITSINRVGESESASGIETVEATRAVDIDAQALADQVSRILYRQMAVERERRGGGIWH
jgi:hypothetical protein